MEKIQSTVAPVSSRDHEAILEQGPTSESSAAMDEVNRRRIELIKKKDRSEAETVELEGLQKRMSDYVNARYPLPFAALERLEQYAQMLKEREDQQ